MLETSKPRTESTADREIVTSRVFDAPRELVFEAWTNPDHIAKWWGPRGFTTTTKSFELRPGGAWVHTMHGPDGKDYPNRLVYDEVARPERIVYTNLGEVNGASAKFQSTITFTARGEKTEVTMRQVFRSARERDVLIEKYGVAEGAKQTLARLAENLAAPSKPTFEISRVFDAPRELVFEAWTKAEHLSRWFAPRPLTVPTCELDFRAGGAFRLVMRAPDGTEYPMETTFREIVVPEKIVFAGKIHGGNFVETTVTFEEIGEGAERKTRLQARQTYSFESDATRGAPMGWGATLDQLGETLKAAKKKG